MMIAQVATDAFNFFEKAARYQLPPSVKYEIFPKSPCQPADFVSNCKLDQALHVYNPSKYYGVGFGASLDQ